MKILLLSEEDLEKIVRKVIREELGGISATKKWMTRKEVAEYLSISTSALDKWSLLHHAPYFRFPGSSLKLYNAQELDEWMSQFKKSGER